MTKGDSVSQALLQKPAGCFHPLHTKTWPSCIVQACSIGFSYCSIRSLYCVIFFTVILTFFMFQIVPPVRSSSEYPQGQLPSETKASRKKPLHQKHRFYSVQTRFPTRYPEVIHNAESAPQACPAL